MDLYARDLPGLFLQGKYDICLILQEGLHAVFILKYRRDLYIRLSFGKDPHCLRKEIQRLPHHHADGNIVFISGTEILPLFDGALQIFAHAGQEGNELCPGRGQGSSLAASLEDRKADFFLQEPDLVGKSRLADEHVVCAPAEVQGMGKLNTVIDLFGGHNVLLLFKN